MSCYMPAGVVKRLWGFSQTRRLHFSHKSGHLLTRGIGGTPTWRKHICPTIACSKNTSERKPGSRGPAGREIGQAHS
eukprot:1841236-Pyramimonas_sp.AAC.1